MIARGGGSLEDLLPFSDEGLVRAVFACRTPVVSAIGHETDNPILDLVADYRASTPTDAAKRVVPDVADELARVAAGPGAAAAGHHHRHRPAAGLADRASGPGRCCADPTATLRAARRAARRPASTGPPGPSAADLERESTVVSHQLARVRAMSPKATLERGYAILVGPEGHAVASDQAELDEGDDLLAHLRTASWWWRCARPDPEPRQTTS